MEWKIFRSDAEHDTRFDPLGDRAAEVAGVQLQFLADVFFGESAHRTNYRPRLVLRCRWLAQRFYKERPGGMSRVRPSPECLS